MALICCSGGFLAHSRAECHIFQLHQELSARLLTRNDCCRHDGLIIPGQRLELKATIKGRTLPGETWTIQYRTVNRVINREYIYTFACLLVGKGYLCMCLDKQIIPRTNTVRRCYRASWTYELSMETFQARLARFLSNLI